MSTLIGLKQENLCCLCKKPYGYALDASESYLCNHKINKVFLQADEILRGQCSEKVQEKEAFFFRPRIWEELNTFISFQEKRDFNHDHYNSDNCGFNEDAESVVIYEFESEFSSYQSLDEDFETGAIENAENISKSWSPAESGSRLINEFGKSRLLRNIEVMTKELKNKVSLQRSNSF